MKKAIDEFKKVNRIKGVDFSKKLKKLVEIYNERKDFETFQSEVVDDLAEQFANLFKEFKVNEIPLLNWESTLKKKPFMTFSKPLQRNTNSNIPKIN